MQALPGGMLPWRRGQQRGHFSGWSRCASVWQAATLLSKLTSALIASEIRMTNECSWQVYGARSRGSCYSWSLPEVKISSLPGHLLDVIYIIPEARNIPQFREFTSFSHLMGSLSQS